MCSIEVDMYKCFFLEICWSEGHSYFGTQWVWTSGRGQGDSPGAVLCHGTFPLALPKYACNSLK